MWWYVSGMWWGKKKLIFQFEYVHKKGMSYYSLVCLSSKEDVDMDEPLSYSPKKEQGELLTIFEGPEVREHRMSGKVMYLSVFYCLCYETDIYIYI